MVAFSVARVFKQQTGGSEGYLFGVIMKIKNNLKDNKLVKR